MVAHEVQVIGSETQRMWLEPFRGLSSHPGAERTGCCLYGINYSYQLEIGRAEGDNAICGTVTGVPSTRQRAETESLLHLIAGLVQVVDADHDVIDRQAHGRNAAT